MMGGRPLTLAILGSTGSIGRQALQVVAEHADTINVVALAARDRVEQLAEQADTFGVRDIAVGDSSRARQAQDLMPGRQVSAGPEAVEELAATSGADVVLNALVGAAGLRATLAALEAGAKLALANKESLVAGGELVTGAADPGQIVPVDSEHSAIHQCLLGESGQDVARLWLTASGGPFRGMSRAELKQATAAEALAHPTWQMGPKITVDSATLMNKGLEVIEAHHLFGVAYDDITVVVHPQSCVHSMVEFIDGSVKAHLGATDMRIPIQYALSEPQRWDGPSEPVDFASLGSLTFEEPDEGAFPCLPLARAAGRAGGTMPAVLNAANEVAVAAFLAGSCGFTDIDGAVESVCAAHDPEPIESLGQIEQADAWSRARATWELDRHRT